MSEEKSTIGSIIGGLVLAAVCGVLGWLACGMWTAHQMKKAQQGPNPMAAMAGAPQSVAVEEVTVKPYNLPERFVAHAEAVQEVDLLPQVDGYVKEVKFREGDVVQAGQLLYVLDDERYQAVVNQRKADLTAAEAEARRAERYFTRMQEADERGITQLERDNAEAAAEKAKAAVLQAKANLIVAEYDCKKAKVCAPIAGQVGKSSVHVGDYVAPSKGALARIVQIDPIRVSFPMTDRAYVAWRQAQAKGQSTQYRMRLLLPDGSEYNQTGAFDFDDNQMSKETASIMMRLSFPNPERLLVPNSYVTLLTDMQNPPSYPTVQQSAIVDLPGGGLGVYVLKPGDTVELRPVETRPACNGLVPLVTGVTAGEKVVISGTRKLRPGAKVTFAKATPTEENDKNYKPFKL